MAGAAQAGAQAAAERAERLDRTNAARIAGRVAGAAGQVDANLPKAQRTITILDAMINDAIDL